MENEQKKGYKKTKLGWIPEEWDIVKLGEVFRITSGGTPNRKNNSYWDKGKIPWVTTTLVDFNIIDDSEKYITELGLNDSSAKIFPKGTILMALYGQGVNRGKVAVLGLDAATNQACAALILNKKNVHSKYFFYYLSNKYKVLRNLSNSGGQKNLSRGLLKPFKVTLPPLPEQQKITTILSTWDKAIEKVGRLIEAKEVQKKGLMQRLLTPKSNWKQYRYGQILKEVRRTFTFDDEALYDLISVRRRSGGLFHRSSLYGRDIKTKNLRTAKEGDFLISKMQILHGASGLTTKEFDGMKISGSYIAVVSKDNTKLDIAYFHWLAKMPIFYYQTYVASHGVHIEKMTFHFKSFLKQPLQLPSLEKQKFAVQVLNMAEKELNVLKQKQDTLKEQKKGLMQQLLTGKIRVST